MHRILKDYGRQGTRPWLGLVGRMDPDLRVREMAGIAGQGLPKRPCRLALGLGRGSVGYGVRCHRCDRPRKFLGRIGPMSWRT